MRDIHYSNLYNGEINHWWYCVRREIIKDIFEKYSSLSVRGCIFSKIDESRFYGPIFNQAVRFRLPIAYFTTGQRVPEDIEAASQKLLKNLLWNGLREN